MNTGHPEFGPFRFQVEEAFKGVQDGIAEIEIGAGLCMTGYKTGQRYLVLARRDEDGRLSTGDCAGTRPIEDADEDVRLLRAAARGTPIQQLQGSVARNTDDTSVSYQLRYGNGTGLAGVRVTASKDGRTYSSATDARGSFRLEVPEPGRYELVAAAGGYSSSRPLYRLDVPAGGCAEQDIGMWTDSRISGIVVDSARRPVAGVPVEMMLTSRDMSHSPFTATSDATGAFRFSKIPAGEYLLGVNLNGFSSSLPYEPSFYPGTAHRQDARSVRIDGPASIANLVLPVGNRLPTRRITVALIWPDGKPVTNGSVMCESSKSTDRRFIKDWVAPYTDRNGEAVCEVLTDRDYQVYAERLAWSASSRPIQPIDTKPRLLVGPGALPADLRITVDRSNDISDQERPAEMWRYRSIRR